MAAMSTIVAAKGTPTTGPVAPTKQVQITPTTAVWALIDDGSGTLTQDHRCAHLQAGIAHKFFSGAGDNRIVMVSDAAQNVDYQESAITSGTKS
jgi:hypothetical protein